MPDLDRRGFLRALLPVSPEKEGRPTAVRPPFVTSLERLSASCPECPGHCHAACEADIIRIGEDRLPGLDFASQGCTFCGDCVEACDRGVLQQPEGSAVEAYVLGTAVLDRAGCVAWNGTFCFACLDACSVRAISFAGMADPSVSATACTGCGFCVSVCPSAALVVEPVVVAPQ